MRQPEVGEAGIVDEEPYALIRDLLRWPGIVCKLCVDLPLFLLSYFVQRELIFKKKRKVNAK